MEQHLSPLRAKLVIAIVLLQMAFFVGWYLKEAGAFNQPVATIMVKTEAYDPRDLLSGQYIRVSYPFSRTSRWDSEVREHIVPDWAEELEKDDSRKARTVWVLLHEVDGFYVAKKASFAPLTAGEGEVLIQGRKSRWSRITYGIEKYFVPEGTKEPSRDDLTVELNVYAGGKVRIKQAFVKGKSWP